MRDGTTHENNKQAPHTTVLPFIDYYIAFETVIQSLFKFFVNIHLILVFDCPFFALLNILRFLCKACLPNIMYKLKLHREVGSV